MSEATELLFTLAILRIPSCTFEERIKMESLFGFGHGSIKKITMDTGEGKGLEGSRGEAGSPSEWMTENHKSFCAVLLTVHVHGQFIAI